MQYSRRGTVLAMAGTLVALTACGESPTESPTAAPTAAPSQVTMVGDHRGNIIFLLTSVSPATATVVAGGTQQFSAIDGGGGVMVAPDVTWSVSGGGSISASGLFTAGTTAGTFTVVATGTANGATVSVPVTITAPAGGGTGSGSCKSDDDKKKCEKEHAGKDDHDGRDDKGNKDGKDAKDGKDGKDGKDDKGKGDDHKKDNKGKNG